MDFRIEAEDLRDAFAQALDGLLADRPRRPSDPVDGGTARWGRLCADGWLDAFLPTDDADRAWLVRGVTVAEALGSRSLPEPLEAVAGFLLPLLQSLPGGRAADTGRAVRAGDLVAGVAPACLGADGRPVGRWAPGAAPVLTAHGADLRITGEVHGVMLPPGATALILPARDPSGSDVTTVVRLPRDRAGIALVEHRSVVPGRIVADVTLDQVVVSPDDLLVDAATPGDARVSVAVRTAAAAFSRTLDGIAIGGAQALLDRTLAYTAEREQFGARIGSFQAVKHQVADAAVLLESSRSLAYVAAWEADEHGVDAAAPTLAASRLSCATMFRRVAETAVQLRGATGFTWEDGTHWWLRAAMFDGSLATDRSGLVASFSAALTPRSS